jgi:hypothetical protein
MYNVQDNYGADVWNFRDSGLISVEEKNEKKKLKNFSHRKVKRDESHRWNRKAGGARPEKAIYTEKEITREKKIQIPNSLTY